MPNLADDDLTKWEYSLHTGVKHRILKQYIGPWSSILGRWHKTLTYVDGFAGRGRYNQGEPGSPLLVIDAAVDRMDRHPGSPEQFVCHFVETNEHNRRNLERELANHPHARDPRIDYQVHPGRFSSACPGIVAGLAASSQPSFFFVDPFGFDDIPLAVLEPIVRLRRSELLINLMTSFIIRAFGRLHEPGMAATLDRVLGSPDWRAIATSPASAREEPLVELYRRSLKGIGVAYAVPFPMGDEEENRIIYYLIHATTHPKGARIMKDEMIKASTPGRVGFNFEGTRELILLLHDDLDRLPALLMGKFKGQTRSLEEVVYQTIEESGACKLEDYRNTVKHMIRTGRARKASGGTGAKDTSLADDDLVEFPS